MVRATARAPRMDVYAAIQEPTRRAILDMLTRGERSVVRIAEPFDMTRPAISQHLRVLKEAGLVRSRRAGRENLYRLEAAPLRAVFDWLSFYQAFWSEHLTSLGRYLDQQSPRKNPR